MLLLLVLKVTRSVIQHLFRLTSRFYVRFSIGSKSRNFFTRQWTILFVLPVLKCVFLAAAFNVNKSLISHPTYESYRIRAKPRLAAKYYNLKVVSSALLLRTHKTRARVNEQN